MIPKSTFLVHFTHTSLSLLLACGAALTATPVYFQARIQRLEVGEAVDGAPGVLGDRLLREEARRRDHREARVGELLLLHDAELGRGLRRPRRAGGTSPGRGSRATRACRRGRG